MHPPSEELFAYRDGELGPEKRAVVEAHVMGCTICRALIDQVSALEAELRQSPDHAPAGYLDHLGEAVRARLAVPGAERALEEPGIAPVERPRLEPVIPPRAERGRVKEAPKLPWAAVVGTASAAVAVMVVVVILIRQGPYQRMVMPERRTVATAPPAETRSEPAAGALDQQKRETPATEGAKNAPAPAETKAKETATPGSSWGKVTPQEKSIASNETRSDQDLRDQLAKKADEVAMKAPAAASQAPTMEMYKDNGSREEAAKVAERGRDMKLQAKPRDSGLIQESGYQAILKRYGLPPVWNRTVTPSTLANAEPDLRSYYMSGGAGQDSARVRLYLAEAARLQYAPGDTELYDEIRHHYQRVIELAGPDDEVARVARDRMKSLEK